MLQALLKSLIKTVVPILTVVLLWEIIFYFDFGNVRLFPPPSAFLKDVIENDFKVGIGAQATPILKSILSSIFRVFAGLLLGFIAALFIGFVISATGKFKQVVMPVISFMAPIAPIAWIPLALVLFGIGNNAAIFIVFMGVFFMLTIATVDSLERVPKKFIDKALTKGASKQQIWLKVKVPHILPQVFVILRLNFIAAWMAVLAAEMTGLNDGLGNIFMTGRNLYNNNLIMLGMFLIAVTGFLFDMLLKTIQTKFFWWGIE